MIVGFGTTRSVAVVDTLQTVLVASSVSVTTFADCNCIPPAVKLNSGPFGGLIFIYPFELKVYAAAPDAVAVVAIGEPPIA